MRAARVTVVAVASATFLACAHGFTSVVMSAAPGGGSYKDRLAAARANRSVPSQPPAAPAVTEADAKESSRPEDNRPQKAQFPPEVAEALNEAIEILHRRKTKKAPLSAAEVQRFSAASAIVIQDALGGGSSPPAQQLSSPAPPAATSVASVPRAQEQQLAQEGKSSFTEEEEFLMETEGPQWDPKKGYGTAAGTVNTYAIEGMESMNPEEYQEAIRQRVIARARADRANSRVRGNEAAKEYYKMLNGDDSD